MSAINANKKSTNYKILVQLAMRLHNPQVAQAYRESLDSDPDLLRPILHKNLTIYPEDSVWEIIIKFILFYLVDSRMWISASTPMWWAQKGESFKPQLCIKYRPIGIRPKFGFSNYASNPELHIPHYNGDNNPLIPSYTIGQFSAKYILKDQTYILVNAASEDESIKVVAQLASYTKLDKRPSGEIIDNLTTTKRKKKLKENGIKIEPYQGEYFEGGKNGLKTLVRLQF